MRMLWCYFFATMFVKSNLRLWQSEFPLWGGCSYLWPKNNNKENSMVKVLLIEGFLLITLSKLNPEATQATQNNSTKYGIPCPSPVSVFSPTGNVTLLHHSHTNMLFKHFTSSHLFVPPHLLHLLYFCSWNGLVADSLSKFESEATWTSFLLYLLLIRCRELLFELHCSGLCEVYYNRSSVL